MGTEVHFEARKNGQTRPITVHLSQGTGLRIPVIVRRVSSTVRCQSGTYEHRQERVVTPCLCLRRYSRYVSIAAVTLVFDHHKDRSLPLLHDILLPITAGKLIIQNTQCYLSGDFFEKFCPDLPFVVGFGSLHFPTSFPEVWERLLRVERSGTRSLKTSDLAFDQKGERHIDSREKENSCPLR